jgi:hypothetical protein
LSQPFYRLRPVRQAGRFAGIVLKSVIVLNSALWLVLLALMVVAASAPYRPYVRILSCFCDQSCVRWLSFNEGMFSLGQIHGDGPLAIKLFNKNLRPLMANSGLDYGRPALTPETSVYSFGDHAGIARVPLVYPIATITVVSVRWWLLLAAVSIFLIPAGWVVQQALRRARRSRRGLCTGCGYDLRGSVSGRCPECGQWAVR